MNQILSVENTKNKTRKSKMPRNSGPIAIESILKFFAISILIFGVFMIGSGSYSMYVNSQGKTSKTPFLSENQVLPAQKAHSLYHLVRSFAHHPIQSSPHSLYPH